MVAHQTLFSALWAIMAPLAASQAQTGRTTTSVWLPEGIPATTTPATLLASASANAGTTTVVVSPSGAGTGAGDWWAYRSLYYFSTSVLSMNYRAFLDDTKCEDPLCTGTTKTFFLSAQCTSTPGATRASCGGKYGSMGAVWTSTLRFDRGSTTQGLNGTRTTISQFSEETPFPTDPRIGNPVPVTITSGGFPTTSTTTSSSKGGVPRQTGSEFLAGAAAAVAGGVALLL